MNKCWCGQYHGKYEQHEIAWEAGVDNIDSAMSQELGYPVNCADDYDIAVMLEREKYQAEAKQATASLNTEAYQEAMGVVKP